MKEDLIRRNTQVAEITYLFCTLLLKPIKKSFNNQKSKAEAFLSLQNEFSNPILIQCTRH